MTPEQQQQKALQQQHAQQQQQQQQQQQYQQQMAMQQRRRRLCWRKRYAYPKSSRWLLVRRSRSCDLSRRAATRGVSSLAAGARVAEIAATSFFLIVRGRRETSEDERQVREGDGGRGCLQEGSADKRRPGDQGEWDGRRVAAMSDPRRPIGRRARPKSLGQRPVVGYFAKQSATAPPRQARAE